MSSTRDKIRQFISTATAMVGSLAIDFFLYRFARRRLSADLRQYAAVAQGRGG